MSKNTEVGKLMAILQREARKQLGRGFGIPTNPDCKGFTVEEIGRLNFSTMDLSELFDDVITAAKNKSAGKMDTKTMENSMTLKFKAMQTKRTEEDKKREEEQRKTKEKK